MYNKNQTQTTNTPTVDYSDDNYSSNDSPTYGEQEQEFISSLIDVEKTLKKFEMSVLRGMYEKIDMATGERRWESFSPNDKPIINESGIREILGRLQGFVNKETVLTYFEEEEIFKNLFYFDMSITETFAKRSDYWELDIETAKSIKDSCVELVMSVLFRARRGFTAINMKTQYSKSDVTRTDSSQQNKKTFLGIPIGGK